MQRQPVPGMAAWWKADSLTLGDDAAVSVWEDSSGNGYHATASGGNIKFRTNVLNGMPIVRLPSDQWLTSTLSAGQPQMTIFTVVKYSLATSNPSVLGGSGNSARQLQVATTTMQMRFVSQNVSQLALGASNTNTTTFYSRTYDRYNNGTATPFTHRLFLNGAQNGSTTTSSTALNPNTTTVIGKAGSSNFAGDIAEIIVYYTPLSTEDRALVHSYLQDKYAITMADYVPPVTASPYKRFNGTEFVNLTVTKF